MIHWEHLYPQGDMIEIIEQTFPIWEQFARGTVGPMLGSEYILDSARTMLTHALRSKQHVDHMGALLCASFALPTRTDVDVLAQQLSTIESRLSALNEKVEKLGA